MRLLMLMLALLEGLLIMPAWADEPQRDPAESDVELAVVEAADSDVDGHQIELTSGSADRSADWQPGLLGHRYVDARYLHFDYDGNAVVERMDDSLQGVDAMFNLPLPRLFENTGFLGIDAFLSHRYLGLSGDTYLPPPDDVSLSLDSHWNTTRLGASLYIDHARLGPFRPFIQLGFELSFFTDQYLFNGSMLEVDEDDLGVIIEPGVEVEITSRSAFRARFDIATEFDKSTVYGDFIVWPWEHVFLRGGFVTNFLWLHNGATIGAGFKF